MLTPWGKHRDDPQGHWPPAITNQEHVAETSDSGGLFLPPALCTTGGTGFATYLDTTLPYKILTLKLPTQWVGQPNPATVGTVTFTVPAGVAIYHCGSGSLAVSGGTLVGSGGILVPAAGFLNETFAILTDENFTSSGAIIANYAWYSQLRGRPVDRLGLCARRPPHLGRFRN